MTHATASITIAFSTALLVTSFANAETQSPPNIVLILSDDPGYTDYGFRGHPEIETKEMNNHPERNSDLSRRELVKSAAAAGLVYTAGAAGFMTEPAASSMRLTNYETVPGAERYASHFNCQKEVI